VIVEVVGMDGWGDGGGCWLGVTVLQLCGEGHTQRRVLYEVSSPEDLVSEEEFQAPT